MLLLFPILINLSAEYRVISAFDLGYSTDDLMTQKILADNDGNIYIAGRYTTDVTLGTTFLQNLGSNDLFVAKIDPDRNVVWSVPLHGPANDSLNALLFDHNGDLLLIGNFEQSITVGNQTYSSIIANDMFISVIDSDTGSSNNFVQAETESDFVVHQALVKPNGHLNILLEVHDDTPFLDFIIDSTDYYSTVIIDLDTSLNFYWQIISSRDFNRLTTFKRIKCDENNNIYTASTLFYGHADLMKFDSSGHLIWSRRKSGVHNTYTCDLYIRNDKIIFPVNYWNQVYIVFSESERNTDPNYSYWKTHEFDFDGNELNIPEYNSYYNTNKVNNTWIDRSGNYIGVYTRNDNYYWYPDSLTAVINYGQKDDFLCRFNDFFPYSVHDVCDNSINRVMDLYIDEANIIYLTGSFYGNTAVGHDSLTTDSISESMIATMHFDFDMLSPDSINAQIENRNDVELKWNKLDPGENGFISYRIYRDSILVHETQALNDTLFVDCNLPNGDYSYCVKTMYVDGESEEGATLDVNVYYPHLIENLWADLRHDVLNLTWDISELVDSLSVTDFEIMKTFPDGTTLEHLHTLIPSLTDTLIFAGNYRYEVRANYLIGCSPYSSPVSFTFNPVKNGDSDIEKYCDSMSECYPNPFNPETNISFTLKEKSLVKITIYNMKGQAVNHLINCELPEGKYTRKWKGQNNQGNYVGSGVYFVIMRKNGKIFDCRKCVLLK